MSYPGEYPQALVRNTNVFCPVVSGYATARLRREDPLFGSGNVAASEDNAQTQVTLRNLGSRSVTVQLKQSDVTDAPGTDSSGSPSGTRLNVGSAVTLVAGGQDTLNVVAYKKFLEVYGTSGGPSDVHVQVSGKIRWEQMAFDKADPLYPAVLRDVRPRPTAPSV